MLSTMLLLGGDMPNSKQGRPVVRPSEALEAGVTRQTVQLDPLHRIWIYRPATLKGKVPLILIAPAGTPLFFGMTLNETDVREEIPYAKAGYVVVSYDVSGPHPKDSSNYGPEIRAFMAARAGISDAKRALNYALKWIKEVDPKRLVAVGHSSAATIALQVTENEPRIRACVAYAPAVDVLGHLKGATDRIESIIPGFRAFIEATSPDRHADRIHVPTLFFHSNDDGIVPAEPIRRMAKAVRGSKLVEVSKGGHYNSMIDQGIPTALVWLKSKGLAP